MRAARLVIPLLLALAAPRAADAAPGPQDRAEATRLAEDMSKLAERGFWKGVDRRYRELVALEAATGVAVSAEDHMTGVDAARNLGLIRELIERLQAAEAAGAPLEGAVARVQDRFGWAELSVESRSADVTLELEQAPFELDARQALEAARAALDERRRFSGYLPVGAYTFGPEAFTVEPGREAPAVVSIGGRGRPVAPKAPREVREPAPTRTAGPRALLRAGVGAGGAGWALTGLQPVAASGFSPALSAGALLPLGDVLGATAEVGWMGLMGRARSSDGGATFNLFVAQAAATATVEGWRFSAGPAWAAGVGKVQGLDEQAAVSECDPADCTDTSQLGRVETTSHWLRGQVMGGGGALGIDRDLSGGGAAVGVRLTGLSDGSRFYTLAQALITLQLGGSR